jgi:hypothetical protein
MDQEPEVRISSTFCFVLTPGFWLLFISDYWLLLIACGADMVDANRGVVLSMAVRFLVLLAALLLEHDYFRSPTVFNDRSGDPTAAEGLADFDLVTVGRQQRIEFD